MDYYNKSQIQQLAPLLTICYEDKNKFSSAIDHLILLIQECNISGKSWDNCILKNRIFTGKYIVRVESTEKAIEDDIKKTKSTENHHSILSPFNPNSDLFPNGILSEKWFLKYTRHLPFAVINFHTLENDTELANVLAKNRDRYHSLGVKYVAILLSDSDPVADQDRVDALRVASGLPRLTGLFYLNSAAATVDRDAKVLAAALIGNLRAPAADFYAAVEAHIKQRSKKYYNVSPGGQTTVETSIELNPRFLEIRNMVKLAMVLQFLHPNNVELALPLLETSYERLIDLMDELSLKFFPHDNLPLAHDSALYAQFRNLLDIIAFHLVRGYFSTEEPIAALRKHQAHLANVVDFGKPFHSLQELAVWTSIQYHWLADLMVLVPNSIILPLNVSSVSKKNVILHNKAIPYFGGFSFHDSFVSRIITHPSLVYLKSYTLLLPLETDLVKFPPHVTPTNFLQLKLQLLDSAAACADSLGLQMYIRWLTAEEMFSAGDFHAAVDHYRAILSPNQLLLPSAAYELVKCRLSESLMNLDDEKGLYESFLSLSITGKASANYSPLKRAPSKNIELTLPLTESAFSVDAVMYNENLNDVFYAYDKVVTQISLQLLVQLSVLRTLLDGEQATVSIKKIEVNYEGRTVVLKQKSDSNDGRKQSIDSNDGEKQKSDSDGKRLCRVHLGQESEYEADLGQNPVVQLVDQVSKAGKYKLESVEVFSNVQVTTAANHTVSFSHSDLHDFINKTHTPHAIDVLGDSDKWKTLRFSRANAVECHVEPYKPAVSISFGGPQLQSILIGEKLELPVEITVPEKPPASSIFSSLSIQQKSRIVTVEGGDQDHLTAQTNWKLHKDEEPLSILEAFDKDGCNYEKGVYQLSVRKPPIFRADTGLVLQIDFELSATTAEAGNLAQYAVASFEFPIITDPFGVKFSVSPRLRRDSSLDFPNPFVLSENHSTEDDAANANFSMPLPARAWCAEVEVDDPKGHLDTNGIVVKNTRLTLSCKAAEILVEPLGQHRHDGLVTSHDFATRVRPHFAHHRNVQLTASAVVQWERAGSNVSNDFETDEWEVTLPLQDPGVFLYLKNIDGDDVIELHYVIENPTPRILTFTASLATEEAALNGYDWSFDALDNPLPLKQSAFPVLPFSRHDMVYQGTCRVSGDTTLQLQLPRLHVYDVNYKVSLATMPVEKDVIIKSHGLWYVTRRLKA